MLCTKKDNRRRENPWITGGIIKSISTKFKLYSKKLKNNTEENDRIYKKYRNFLNRTIENRKREYYKQKLLDVQNQSKDIWLTMNEIIGKKRSSKSKIKQIVDSSGKNVTSRSDIANTFNKYFVNVGKNLASKIPPRVNTILSDRVGPSFRLFNTSVVEVSNLINDLNHKKSNCIVDAPTNLIKTANYVIAPILSDIFNYCMTNGCYPDQLKIAHVIPIYKKKGKKNECESYRPISLLGNINRLFEKLIYKRLYDFFHKFNVLNFNQYGFRKNHSTAMAIYDILESKISNHDKDKVSCAVYLDLSKAFDTVDKSILLKKLEHFGIRGIGLKLLENYLTNRKQCVMIDGLLSDVLSIDCGVPQGSNLGPLLFLIYVNDLPEVSNLITKLFADDTCLFFYCELYKRTPKYCQCRIKAHRELDGQ